MIGRVCRLPHVTVVPYERTKHGFLCVVVESRHASYPVNGYNILVFQDDLDKAAVVELAPREPGAVAKTERSCWGDCERKCCGGRL